VSSRCLQGSEPTGGLRLTADGKPYFLQFFFRKRRDFLSWILDGRSLSEKLAEPRKMACSLSSTTVPSDARVDRELYRYVPRDDD